MYACPEVFTDLELWNPVDGFEWSQNSQNPQGFNGVQVLASRTTVPAMTRELKVTKILFSAKMGGWVTDLVFWLHFLFLCFVSVQRGAPVTDSKYGPAIRKSSWFQKAGLSATFAAQCSEFFQWENLLIWAFLSEMHVQNNSLRDLIMDVLSPRRCLSQSPDAAKKCKCRANYVPLMANCFKIFKIWSWNELYLNSASGFHTDARKSVKTLNISHFGSDSFRKRSLFKVRRAKIKNTGFKIVWKFETSMKMEMQKKVSANSK